MQIPKEKLSEIEELKSVTDCPKEFSCLNGKLCKDCYAYRLIGAEMIECKIENSKAQDFFLNQCDFRIPFGDGFFCKCPMRVYLLKNLGV